MVYSCEDVAISLDVGLHCFLCDFSSVPSIVFIVGESLWISLRLSVPPLLHHTPTVASRPASALDGQVHLE